MLADGSLRTMSPTENRELLDLVVGGYGLFGVIVEAEFDIDQSNRRQRNLGLITALTACAGRARRRGPDGNAPRADNPAY